jgi:hypothetical protein
MRGFWQQFRPMLLEPSIKGENLGQLHDHGTEWP